MDTISSYEAWKAWRQQAGAAAAGIVLDGVAIHSPDEAAGDMQLAEDYAKVTGWRAPSLSFIQENRSVFQRAIERRRNSTFLSASPILS